MNKPSNTFYRYFPVANRDREWGLYVTGVGASQYGPGTTYPTNGRARGHSNGHAFATAPLSEYRIVYISAGSGRFKTDALPEQKVEAGQAMLLFPGAGHSYAPSQDTGWNEHWVGFDGDIIRQLARHDFFKPQQPVLNADNEEKLLALFNEIIEIAGKSRTVSQQILSAITMNILALLYSSRHSQGAEDGPGQKFIQEAVARMRESAEQPLDIQELARKAEVSYSYFRKTFALHTGISPHKYLQEIRLARARTLLSQSTLSVKEIAARTGFKDAQYFCRIFHKKAGRAPTTFRSLYQKS